MNKCNISVACFQIWPNFPFPNFPNFTIVHAVQKNQIELAQKFYASRGWCEMHACTPILVGIMGSQISKILLFRMRV